MAEIVRIRIMNNNWISIIIRVITVIIVVNKINSNKKRPRHLHQIDTLL